MRKAFFIMLWLLTYIEGTDSVLVEMVTENIYSRYIQMVDNGIDISEVTEITFELKVCNDGFVGLSESKTSTAQFYEILLGGWGGSRLGIRNGVSADLEDYHDDASLFDCGKYREFWVRWAGGLVQAGSGLVPGVSKLVEWLDPAPHTVNFLSISSGFGATGYWKFYNRDGGWAAWGAWSTCVPQPEGVLQNQRTRTCSDPPPEVGGSCIGGEATELGETCDPPANMDKRKYHWTRLQNNGKIALGTFGTTTSWSRTDCCRFCQETESCEGVSFERTTSTCIASSQYPQVGQLESADAWETWVRI